ncbi:unnamed protein product [Calypogeia fissa]
MGFVIGTIAIPEFSEATRRQLLGQVMDLNCLTWVVALGLVEQRRMRTTLVASYPLVSLQPTETVQAAAGGGGPSEGQWDFISQNPGLQKRHPWTSWDVICEQVAASTSVLQKAGIVGEQNLTPPKIVA